MTEANTSAPTPADPTDTPTDTSGQNPPQASPIDEAVALPPRPPTANPINAGAIAHESGEPVSDTHPAHALAGAVDAFTSGSSEPEYPDGLVPEWHDPILFVTDVERYAAKSHGLTSDVELLKKIARHLRAEVGVPPIEMVGTNDLVRYVSERQNAVTYTIEG